MNDQRRALGRGLAALLPTAPTGPLEPLEPRERFTSPSAWSSGTGTTGGSPVDLLIPARAADPADADVGTEDRADSGAEDATGSDAEVGAYYAEVPVGSITPNPRQPRQVFDEEAMAELVSSIREVGLLQPVVVRPLGEDRFELVMGERRWRAAREAGLEVLPAIVRTVPESDLLRDALLENLHRSALNPLEEAAAYDQLLRDFGCSHEDLASRLGRSRPQISNTLRLLRLPPAVQRRVAAGVLSAGHARALLAVDDSGGQERLAQRVVSEGLSVRAVEEIVALGSDATKSDASGAPRRHAVPVPVAPRLHDLAARLSDRFETRVSVELGRRRGKIVIEFATLEDLERIVEVIDQEPVEDAAAGVGDPAPVGAA